MYLKQEKVSFKRAKINEMLASEFIKKSTFLKYLKKLQRFFSGEHTNSQQDAFHKMAQKLQPVQMLGNVDSSQP